MNRKSFLILLLVLLVLGGAGLALFWQDLGTWRSSEAKVGAKLFDKLPVNDVVQIHLVDAQGEATLLIKDDRWVVAQRRDYSANYQAISDLLIKLPDLKVVQTESVGPTLLPRLNLVPPGKAADKDAGKDAAKDAAKEQKDGTDTGTQLELIDKSGKVIASLLLGKKVIKEEDSPLPIKQKKEVGRYVLSPGNPTVLVISDALSSAEAKPDTWLAKNFFKVDRVKSLSSGGDGASWKIARSEEYGQWKFADGAEQLNTSVATPAIQALAAVTFTDVVPDFKRESLDKPRTFVAETFDNLTYTIKFAKKPDEDSYYLWFTVSGDPPRERTPEKGEKAEDKARYDKDYVEDLKKLDARLKLERDLSAWTYVVAEKALDPLLKSRAQLVPEKRPPAEAPKK